MLVESRFTVYHVEARVVYRAWNVEAKTNPPSKLSGFKFNMSAKWTKMKRLFYQVQKTPYIIQWSIKNHGMEKPSRALQKIATVRRDPSMHRLALEIALNGLKE